MVSPCPTSIESVEIWHCDAGGVYSGYESLSQGAGTTPGEHAPPVSRRAAYRRAAESTRSRPTATAPARHQRTAGRRPGALPHRLPRLVPRAHPAHPPQGPRRRRPSCTPGRSSSTSASPPRSTSRQPYRSHGQPDTSHAADTIFAPAGRSKALLKLTRRRNGRAGHAQRSRSASRRDGQALSEEAGPPPGARRPGDRLARRAARGLRRRRRVAVGAQAVKTTDGATATVEPKTRTAIASRTASRGASCTVTPQLTEGPYYFDVDSIRSDITEDRDGMPLRLGLRVQDADSCEPIQNAIVDIWHCDATGSYSGFESAAPGGRSARRRAASRRADLPARRPGDQQARHRRVQDDLPRLVSRSHRAHPRQGPSRQADGPDLTAVLRRRLQRDRVSGGALQLERGRDVFNDDDGIFDQSLVMTTSEEDEGVLALLTFNVSTAPA